MMKKKIYILVILYFIFGISVNLIHPITANYVRSLNLNDTYFGLFFSFMSIGMFIGALIFGKLSDRIGKTIILCLGLIGYAIFQFCFGFLNTIPLLILVFRLGSGICISAPHTLFLSYVRDIENKENVGKAFTLMSSFYLLGVALGYKIGGFLYSEMNLSFLNIFITQAVVLIVLASLFFLLFKKENNTYIVKSKYSSLLNLKKYDKYLVIFLVSLLFLTLAQTIVTKYIDVFVIDLNYDSNDLGDTILFSGIIGIVVNLVFFRVIKNMKKINYELIYLILIIISVLSLTITFTINQRNFIFMMYTTYAVFIASKSLMLPLEQTIISINSEGNSGEIMGVRQSFVALGQVFGPLIASGMYELNHYSVFYFSIGIYFLMGIILLVNLKSKIKAIS